MNEATPAIKIQPTIFLRQEDVTNGHDVALDAYLTQMGGSTPQQAAQSLTNELMSIALSGDQAELAATIYGAVLLLTQFAGIPSTGEKTA